MAKASRTKKAGEKKVWVGVGTGVCGGVRCGGGVGVRLRKGVR